MHLPFKLSLHEGWAVYAGCEVKTRLHVHHAVEIVLSVDKPFLIAKNNKKYEESSFSIVAANVPHRFTGANGYCIFIYLDANADDALLLTGKLQLRQQELIHLSERKITAARTRLVDWLNDEELSRHVRIVDVVKELLHSITGHESSRVTTIDSRIKTALSYIRSSLQQELSLRAVAAKCFLSPSRFAHLFKEQTGVPFRRYILWCRLQLSLKAVQNGASLTEAAYEGGFSDGAHLSRTFTEMFGIAPSEVLK